MTVQEFNAKIERVISALEKENKPLLLAVQSVNALRAKRIFVDGLNSSGGKIGNYENTKPVYVKDSQAPKKVNHKGKTGKTIESGYYKSYKDFRSSMGRESGFINLRLNNDLQSDMSNCQITKDSNSVPAPAPIKVDTNTYKVSLKRPINAKKKEGLEKKYGPVFAHTKEELDKYYGTLAFEQKKILESLK